MSKEKRKAKKTGRSIVKKEVAANKRRNKTSDIRLKGVKGAAKDQLKPQVVDENIPYSQEEMKKVYELGHTNLVTKEDAAEKTTKKAKSSKKGSDKE